MYEFTDIPKGKYSVIFEYDSKKYYITEYQKEGVDNRTNSDIIDATIKIDNEEIKCAKTKVLELSQNDLGNIDAGFIEAETFDLKLEKYINAIRVQTGNETQTIVYNKAQLAKAEISAKKLAGSNVQIEYSMEVTNEGDVPGYASEIVDYISKDLKINSNENRNWTIGSDGNLYTTELANQLIMPGETKSVKLVATKEMTQNNTGSVLNVAEISKHYNEYALNDIDSTPANENNAEDDISTVETIISVKTGRAILYIGIAMLVISILITGIYFIKRKVIER